MPAGRPPKPAKLHHLQGTAQPCRMNPDEPEPDPVVDLSPPFHIAGDAEAAAFWDAQVPQLHTNGLLTVLDVAQFATACEWWSVYRVSREAIRAPAPGETRVEAAMRQATTAWGECSKILARFGMTPSDRRSVKVAGDKKPAAQTPGQKWRARNVAN